LVSFSFTDKRFKVINSYVLEIENGKKDSFGVFNKFSFTSMKISLILKYKYLKLVRAICKTLAKVT